MVSCTDLGAILDLQGSSGCRRHQEAFLKEVLGAIEVSQVKMEGRPFPPSESSRYLTSGVTALSTPGG